MLCYKNGALAREEVRDRYAAGDWARFNELVEKTPPGNGDLVGLYFPLPEIIPPNVWGKFFFRVPPSDGEVITPMPLDDLLPTAHPRAILESQFLSIRSRIAAISPNAAYPLRRLVVTGGSSANQTRRELAAV